MTDTLGSTSFIVLTPPSVEPITLSDVKDWLNIDFADKDSAILNLMRRARRRCETLTGRAWASQQIQAVYPITRPVGGDLSGTIDSGPNWYQYQEQLGANPFGAAQFYFDLPLPPVDITQTVTVETKITAFDSTWTTFLTGIPSTFPPSAWIDNVQEPARMYFQSPITANFWRFTLWVGYGSTTFPLPEDLQECLFEMIALLYDYREGDTGNNMANIEQKLLSKRSADAWL